MGSESPGTNKLSTKGNSMIETKRTYVPSPKHDEGGWGSPNPISSIKEGQKLLDTGISDGKQIYNITSHGEIVKFQPDNTPNNGYHSYVVDSCPRDIPPTVLKSFLNLGKIDEKTYRKYIKNKVGKGKSK